MAIIHVTNRYAIPRGRVYFDRFDAAGLPTGEIAMGNCPGFTFTTDTEKAEHFSSETGLSEKDAALIVRVNRTGSLTCDNFSTDNLALFVSGSTETKRNLLALWRTNPTPSPPAASTSWAPATRPGRRAQRVGSHCQKR